MHTPDLFATQPEADSLPERRVALGPQACVLRGFALPQAEALLAAVDALARDAPFRHMETPGGRRMSAALTGCGRYGWTSDRRGYRYSATDPQTGAAWPAMPALFLDLARRAAAEAGFAGFVPDACLVNRYAPGSRLGLHQDRDEGDLQAPIVSVSLGIPAVFLFGGLSRSDATARVPLFHGDVVVWGGVDRLRHHGVLPIREAAHPRLGVQRINLSFRRAGA